MHDDDRADRFDYDPRWEVQPENDGEDDPGSNTRLALIATVAMTVVAMVLVWLVMNAQSAS